MQARPGGVGSANPPTPPAQHRDHAIAGDVACDHVDQRAAPQPERRKRHTDQKSGDSAVVQRRKQRDLATCCLEILLRAGHASWRSPVM